MYSMNEEERIKVEYRKTLNKYIKLNIITFIISILIYIISTKLGLGVIGIPVFLIVCFYNMYFNLIKFKCPKCGFPLKPLHFFSGKCTNCKCKLR